MRKERWCSARRWMSFTGAALVVAAAVGLPRWGAVPGHGVARAPGLSELLDEREMQRPRAAERRRSETELRRRHEALREQRAAIEAALPARIAPVVGRAAGVARTRMAAGTIALPPAIDSGAVNPDGVVRRPDR